MKLRGRTTPCVIVTSEFVDHFVIARVNPGVMILRMIVLAVVGGSS